MPKQTLSDIMAQRFKGDRRALNGAIHMTEGNPTIVFPAMGNNPRMEIAIDGDDLVLKMDPRRDEPESAPEPDPAPEPEPAAVVPPVETPDNPETPLKPEVDVNLKATTKRGKGK